MSEAILEEARRKKLEYLKEVTNPYPERFEKTHEIAEAKHLDDGTTQVKTAGRILLIRRMGKTLLPNHCRYPWQDTDRSEKRLSWRGCL